MRPPDPQKWKRPGERRDSTGRGDNTGGEASAGKSSTDLIRALRWHAWPPAEAQALARRRALAELRRRHQRAAVSLYGRDTTMCRWHADRMAELHRRGAHR
jgi:hypothetical protein